MNTRNRNSGEPVWRMPSVAGGLIALFVISVLLAARIAGGLQFLDLVSWDVFISLRGADSHAPRRVVTVAVTEEDIAELGSWPLSDAMLAGALQRLVDAGARVVGVDMYRDTPVAPGSEQLDKVLGNNPQLIVVKKFSSANAPGVRPPALLEGTDRVGFTDVVVDSNGIVRRGLLFLDDRNTVSYSLALRLAMAYLAHDGIYPQQGEPDPSHIRLGEVTIPPLESNEGPYYAVDTAGYQFLLDYRDGPEGFATVSLGELLDGSYPADLFRDKVVVFGVSAQSVKDIFFTPFNTGIGHDEGTSGIQVHAYITSQLLHAALDGQSPPRSVPEEAEMLWSLLWIAAGVITGLSMLSFNRLLFVVPAGIGLIAIVGYAAFSQGWWFPVMPPALGWLAAAGLATAYLSRYERRQRSLLMNLFGRHVSPDVAEEIWRNREQYFAGGRLRSRKQCVTTLFSDIEHFTSVSERLDPEALMGWLNEYMEEMATLIMQYGGTVDDFYGDAIKGDFGVPVLRTTREQERQDAVNAVACALAMRERLDKINSGCRERGLPQLRMRIGISTGNVVAGCLGSSMRMKYTTIGDPVNTAARLESLDKQSFGALDAGDCRILIADSTRDMVGRSFRLSPAGSMQLKGKEQPVAVFSVDGYESETVVPLHGRR